MVSWDSSCCGVGSLLPMLERASPILVLEVLYLGKGKHMLDHLQFSRRLKRFSYGVLAVGRDD